MARRKPLKIDELYHKQSGITVPIYLSVSGNYFQTTLPNGDQVGDQVRGELDKKIKTWLDENTVLEWLPLIQVDEYSLSYGDSTNLIGFDLSRMYYAKKKSGAGMMYKHWEPTKEGKEPAWEAKWGFEADKFNPPVKGRGYRDNMTFYLPYSEDLWDTLQMLQKCLGWFKLNLRSHLETGELEGLSQLLLDMVKIAPVPVEKKSKFGI